eukprot:CAMPEP_0175875174 /NCGR_PEP_ID=MMETSP0107_2-20121207/39312_1 /TAXON_ID=195067 ORGANISM="Goniomonas pacifica, Strain CCMP1869" /NCGR_SAMPLE_ID=MMETSP0107_2 /ASSEMBLY_ACC=CAM_ASM_000203 /LENGTH=134 /DNA_ID=CAMNT_0017194171 /DNA_START=385 /DNA_END=789 /DNA_ORIENTATION=+
MNVLLRWSPPSPLWVVPAIHNDPSSPTMCIRGPSCPVPFSRLGLVCPRVQPTATARTPVAAKLEHGLGTELLRRSPQPRLPECPSPQTQTSPERVKAAACREPAATSSTGGSPSIVPNTSRSAPKPFVRASPKE